MKRFHLASPSSQAFRVTHDDRHIVYVQFEDDGSATSQLYAKPLDSLEARAVPGTEDARDVFLSPDGSWLGFVTSGQLKRTRLTGELPTTIADIAVWPRGGSWSTDGTIYVGADVGPLYAVPEDGGALEALTSLEPGEIGHRYPEVLPGGRFVLFTAWRGTTETSSVVAHSLATGERQTLVRGATRPIYSPSGHLLYTRDTVVFGATFDAERAELVGPPVALLKDVSVGGYGARGGDTEMALSRNGTLVYRRENVGLPLGELVLIGRGGTVSPLLDQKRFFSHPRVSPDGERIAVTVTDPRSRHPADPVDSDVWIVDVERRAMNRLTFEGRNGNPVWSPDGTRLAMSTDRFVPGVWGTAVTTLGGGEIQRVTSGPMIHVPSDWSAAGEIFLFTFGVGSGRDDIMKVGFEDGELQPLFTNDFRENSAALSPDGRALAYNASELGEPHVYVTSYPSLRETVLVSRSGGTGPRWSRDGKELFYRSQGKMFAVSIETAPELAAGEPEALFDLPPYGPGADRFGGYYDVMPDGEHFVLFRPEGPPGGRDPETHIVLNFFEELDRAIPKAR